MGKTQIIGNAGERLVSEYLKSQGFLISKRNYRAGHGEIDVVAENNETILFVEVKTRTLGGLGRPADYVTKQKQQRIISAARAYMMYNAVCLQARFDVAEVFVDENGAAQLNYITDAFGVDSNGYF